MARTQNARADHVSRKSEHATDHGQPADRADRPIKIHRAGAALRVADRRLAVATRLALGLLGCSRLGHIGRREIDRIEQYWWEAEVLDSLSDDLARKRK